jgi:hypothetical protein
MSFTTKQARRELDKLERKLKGYEALLLRKQQLETFLSLADKLSSKPRTKSQPVSAEPMKIRHHMKTTDVAAQVLQRHGELHLNNLYQQMRAMGWTGSGNADNERKAIYVAMLREPSRFDRVGRNVWALKQAEAKVAS